MLYQGKKHQSVSNDTICQVFVAVNHAPCVDPHVQRARKCGSFNTLVQFRVTNGYTDGSWTMNKE